MNKAWNLLWVSALLSTIYNEANSKSIQSDLIPVGIVNGTEAADGEFPYLVQIYRYGNRFLCGGSIIADRWILTAGHCVTGTLIDKIVYGTNVLYDEKESPKNNTIEVEMYYRHPKYITIGTGATMIVFYDVGLLKLAEPIPFGDKAQPIKLADAGYVPFHVNGTLAGWGVNSTFGSLPSSLRKINLQLLTDEECRQKIDAFAKKDLFNATHNICSDDNWNGECFGDSGSPFVINGTQYGIVSWSLKPCGSNPGTYSRITTPDYRQYIKDLTGV